MVLGVGLAVGIESPWRVGLTDGIESPWRVGLTDGIESPWRVGLTDGIEFPTVILRVFVVARGDTDVQIVPWHR